MNLTELQHSVFLQALGSAILNSLWQGLLLWLVYETTCISYKNASARFKNSLSTILLFSSFAWFVVSLWLQLTSHTSLVSDIAGTVMTYNEIHSASAIENFFTKAAASLPYLSSAYILLLAFLTIKLLNAYRYVYLISNKHLIAPPAALQDFASGVSQQLTITKKISVWISKHIDVPATVGFIKPVILIPVASLNNLSGEQLEAIILHELSHIRRNDFIINILISVVETILFFNPFVVLLSKAMKRERENCCDDFVLKYQYDPHSYANALLRLEQSRLSSLKLAMGAVSGKKQLLSRIKRITNDKAATQQLNYGQRLIALLLVTGVICSIAWLSPTDNKHLNKISAANKELQVQPQKSALALHENLQDDMNETSSAKNQKPFTAKKDAAVTTANDILNNVIDTLAGAVQSNDFLKELKDGPLATNLESSGFVFDEKKFKLPKSINLKDILPGNANLTIDLSKMDVNELNKGLNEAYRQINSLDWKKVGSDIRKAFEQVKQSNSSYLERLDKLMKNAQGYYKLTEDKVRRAEFEKLLEDQMKIQKQVEQQDSLLARLRVNNNTSYNTHLAGFYRVPASEESRNFYTSISARDPQDVILVSGTDNSAANAYENVEVSTRHTNESAHKTKTAKSFQGTLNSSPRSRTEETIVDL